MGTRAESQEERQHYKTVRVFHLSNWHYGERKCSPVNSECHSDCWVGPLTRLLAAMIFAPGILMSQTNDNYAANWLAKAELPPPFKVPASLPAWQAERQQVRAQVWELLGQLPPRPKAPAVEIVSREDRGDYLLEKFQFDNGAGAAVPGYCLLPKNRSAKAPAILYCHWHGGEYNLGKEELFEAKHTPELSGAQPWPGAALSCWRLTPIASASGTDAGREGRKNAAATAK